VKSAAEAQAQALPPAPTPTPALTLAHSQTPQTRWLAPPLSSALGPELRHWVPTLITTAVNIVAVVVAWYLQQVVSAFYSALRGGKLFGSALFSFLGDRGWLAKLPCVAKPFEPDESNLDEIVGYVLAAAGFVFQLQAGFALFFPLNLVLLPLTVVEWGSVVKTHNAGARPPTARAALSCQGLPLGPRGGCSDGRLSWALEHQVSSEGQGLPDEAYKSRHARWKLDGDGHGQFEEGRWRGCGHRGGCGK